MEKEPVQIEVCCYHIASALAAEAGGADRVELCDNYFEGGTTPSLGALSLAKKKLDIPLFAMIRPRGGDFLYSPEELEIMRYDIRTVKKLGIEGVVLGVLKADGTLDTETMSVLVAEAKPMEVTLHRAFDLTIDPFQALEDAIGLGIDRILTSGQKQKAYDGIPLIKSLVELAGDAITIMPGSGINEQTIAEILNQTGVSEFHISARSKRSSQMKFQVDDLSLGDPRSAEYSLDVADKERIKNYRKLIRRTVKY